MLRLSLQLHKWIALIVGVQVLFWVVGGLVMTAIPIERVRSEHHLAERKPSPLPLASLLPPQEAARRAAVVPVEAVLKSTPRGPGWVFKTAAEETVEVDARTGARLRRITGAEARTYAARAYKGTGRPVAARFYAEAPQETGREGPLWRVDFDDAERTAFYLDPETAEVVTRRSAVWRFYDFWWRLHILDLKTGQDFNHPLLIGLTALTLPMVITGVILLWIRLSRDWKTLRARRPRA